LTITKPWFFFPPMENPPRRKHPPAFGATAEQQRQARLAREAEALRANLRKRKEQARNRAARAEPQASPAAQAEEPAKP